MATYLALVSCILLAAVAAFLVLVGWQLRRVFGLLKQAPALGDALGGQLMGARSALTDLQKTARDVAPVLEGKVREAVLSTQDLKFLTERAEGVLLRLEAALDEAKDAHTSLPGVTVTVTPTVATAEDKLMGNLEKANHAAAREPGEQVQTDPLETLLAGLSAEREANGEDDDASNVTVLRGKAPPEKPRRRTPTTQAELDLQAAAVRKAG